MYYLCIWRKIEHAHNIITKIFLRLEYTGFKNNDII